MGVFRDRWKKRSRRKKVVAVQFLMEYWDGGKPTNVQQVPSHERETQKFTYLHTNQPQPQP